MVNKKMNKKGMSTIMGIVISLLIVIGIFSGFNLFFSDQLEQNSASLDSKYNQTYYDLLEVQDNMDSRVDEVKNTADEVREAESGIIAAINGFKGIGQSMLLLLGFTADSVDTTQAVFRSTDIIPEWIQSLVTVALIGLVVFLVLDVLLGRKPITN